MTTLPPIDTAPLFAPLHDRLLALLDGLTPQDWTRGTIAGAWQVRDVVAHLLDVDLRRLTVTRDAQPIDPGRAIENYADLVAFLNDLNAQWVAMARRFSPRVLVDLLRVSGAAMAQMVTELPPHEPAAFGVAWAGERQSENWFDIGRDYTERWHHQMQIRDAVGAPGLLERRWLLPLLDLSVRSLPVAYANVDVSGHVTVALHVPIDPSDEAAWTLFHEESADDAPGPGRSGPGRWQLRRGAPASATTAVRLDPDTAWRLFYNALPPDHVRQRALIRGDQRLAEPLFRARSVMV
jgi:hypothetical protein